MDTKFSCCMMQCTIHRRYLELCNRFTRKPIIFDETLYSQSDYKKFAAFRSQKLFLLLVADPNTFERIFFSVPFQLDQAFVLGRRLPRDRRHHSDLHRIWSAVQTHSAKLVGVNKVRKSSITVVNHV